MKIASLLLVTRDNRLAKNVVEPGKASDIIERFKAIRRLDSAEVEKLFAKLGVDSRYCRLQVRTEAGTIRRHLFKFAATGEEIAAEADFADDEAAEAFALSGLSNADLVGTFEPSSPDGYTMANVAACIAFNASLKGEEANTAPVAPQPEPSAPQAPIFASNAAESAFNDSGLDLENLPDAGSGKAGAYTAADIKAAVDAVEEEAGEVPLGTGGEADDDDDDDAPDPSPQGE